MLKLFSAILLASFVFVSTNKSPRKPISRIIGGVPLDIANASYVVSISKNYHGYQNHSCCGAIIGARWILTVAHCDM